MPHTRAKTIEALEAKSVADEKKIRDLEAYKKWAYTIRKAHDKRFIHLYKQKREDKARIAKLLLDASEGERACVELADVKKKNGGNGRRTPDIEDTTRYYNRGVNKHGGTRPALHLQFLLYKMESQLRVSCVW